MSKYTLPPNHQQAIISSLRALHDAEEHVAKAEACKLDCTQQRAQMAEIRERLELLRKHFSA